jgi:type I restriction enzyme S subunit
MKKPGAISREPSCFPDDEPPERWKFVTIFDTCEVNPPKPSKDFLPADAQVTFVPMPAVDADMGAITNPQIKSYLEVRNGFTSFRDGDVIMAKITPCMENGKAAVVRGMKNGIGFGSTEFHVMRSRGTILPEYLHYFIRQESFRNEAESHFTGSVGQKRVPADFIKQSVIPLPPLAEQQRIVACVEALLTHINAARDRLSRVPLIMKRFRQAVLAAACSGRLTEAWRGENPSTDTSDQFIELLMQELHKKSIKNKKNSGVQLTQWEVPEPLELLEIPENWTWIALKDTTSLLQYGISVKSDSDEKSGIPILRMGNIQQGSIDLTDLKYIPANTDFISNFIVETGDILFNRTNSPELVGKSAVYSEKHQAVFASYLVRVRPNSNLILSDYLCWWINSMWGREWARNVRTDGVSQSNINAQKLSVMPVPLPPLAEQYEIVRCVNALFERADQIEQQVVAATKRTEALTQAVLGKAFRGELTRNYDESN